MGEDQMLEYETAGEENISSSDNIRELDGQAGQLLFDRFLPDLMSNFAAQDGDPFGLEFTHSNTDGTMSESTMPPCQSLRSILSISNANSL